MKGFKYAVIVLLSTLNMIVPIGCVYGYVMLRDKVPIYPWAILGAISLILNAPLKNARIALRKDVEYDEFGRSKTKGDYASLSKKERDAIDLQKTADMERIMDSSALKKMTKAGSANPQKDLEAMIGLLPVKEKIKELVARMEFEKEESKKKKQNTNSMSGRHMVFYGSPGTGKTTVARILTGFLYQNGYIKKNKCVEIDGNFLKAGQDTAIKTDLVIRQAYDGVLFIDEAYALMESGDGSGEQAIATLIKQMEDKRDKFILIMAGYTNEMKKLLGKNPGFASRIKEYLMFPDYNEQELREIFTLMAGSQNFAVSGEAFDAFDERMAKEKRLRSYGNGRTVRNVLDESIDKHALNFKEGRISAEKKYILQEVDIERKVRQLI